MRHNLQLLHFCTVNLSFWLPTFISTRVGNLLIGFSIDLLVFLWAKEQFACEKERITAVALLSWATWVNHSRSLFCSERPEQFAHSCSFVQSDLSDSLFGIKRGENCKKHTKNRIFLQIFTSKSLVFERFAQVALLSWATWAYRSGSLFNLSDFERKSKLANSQPWFLPNKFILPASYLHFYQVNL